MNIAIILAGGTGSRIDSEVPKQFIELSGQMMIMYALRPFVESGLVDKIQIVANESWRDKIEKELFEDQESALVKKFTGFSDPGENRQMSIYNALRDIRNNMGHCVNGVIIHDAARPFVTVRDIDECLKALDIYEGAMPVLQMKDTVYLSRSGEMVDELLNRNYIYAGQAPEAFRFDKYYEANEALLPDKILMIKGSTEPAVMAGMNVALIPGNQKNFKVTTNEDLERARELLG